METNLKSDLFVQLYDIPMTPQTDLPGSVTLEHVKSVIKHKCIYEVPNSRIVVVTLFLENGASAVGVSYGTILEKDNNHAKGIEIAEKQAIDKVFELENYLLRQRHYEKLKMATTSVEIKTIVDPSVLINENTKLDKD